MKNNEKKHLPIIGVGPLIVIPQLLLTILGIILNKLVLNSYELVKYKIPLIVAGVLVIVCGLVIWSQFFFNSKIDECIINNVLMTTGVYAWVRNPSYSAFWMLCLGAILITANPLLLIIPVICWAYMTIFLKRTEEVWLKNLYGQQYIEYCNKVNRCIPWFPVDKSGNKTSR